MVKMAASDEDSRSEVSEILASCTSPKKKDSDQNSETSSDPFEVRILIFDTTKMTRLMMFFRIVARYLVMLTRRMLNRP